MKLFYLIPTLGILAAGCTSTQAALYTGNYGSMFQQMDGTGTMLQRSDGTQGFRFVIQTDAYDGITPGDPENLRTEALARWLGNEKVCQKGYTIDKRIVNTRGVNAIIYEGHCK